MLCVCVCVPTVHLTVVQVVRPAVCVIGFLSRWEDAFTDLTSSLVCVGWKGRREKYTHFLSLHIWVCLRIWFHHFLFFSLFFLEKRKTLPFRLSGSNGGSCFKCWPCPFCFLALFFFFFLVRRRRWKLIRLGAFFWKRKIYFSVWEVQTRNVIHFLSLLFLWNLILCTNLTALSFFNEFLLKLMTLLFFFPPLLMEK